MTFQKRNSRRLTPTLLSCALASCLAIVAPATLAQSTAATLRGTVTANAQVTATNLANGYVSRAQASANGAYVLPGLPPGTYRVDATANGQTSSRTVTLQIGQAANLNLAGGTAAPAELATVTVVGVAMPDTKTSEISSYVSNKQIESLPQGNRNFLAFADIVPGMVFTTESDGSTKLRSGAQNSNGINVFIDGVGQKNYVVKGGITGQDSSSGNPFPQLGIAEYKVITSNYKAEYDQVSSAVITAVTRSGSNQFHGEAFIDYTNEGLRLPTLGELNNGGDKVESTEKQYGFSVGGPIILDQMHYFFTYERKEIDRPRSISPGQGFSVSQLPSSFQALANATSSAPFEEDLFFGKIDWSPGENHLFELSAKYRTEDELTSVGGLNSAEYGTTKAGEDTRIDLRWQYTADRWLNDAHLTFEDASFGPRAVTIAPGYQLTGNQSGAPAQSFQVILNAGGGPDFQDKGQRGVSFQDDITFNSLDWGGGTHTVKAGMKYKAITINAFEQQPYNAQYSYDINGSLTTPYQVRFGAVTGGGDRNITSRNKQFGIYVQDDWEVNEHLLLNLGVRWDHEQTPGYFDYVTPAPLATALRNWSNINQPATGYDIEDYISDGSNRDAFKGAWQPRFGFSYDINADQRHVIFGGAGRSYDRNLFDYLSLEQSKSNFPSYEFRFNSPGHPCVVGVGNCLAFNPGFFDPAALAALVAANPNLGTEVNLINNDLKTPYSDQFSIGMRNTFDMFGNDWNSSVTYAHVISRDGIVFTLGNRRANGTFFPPNVTFGNAPFGFPIPGYGALIIADNGIETKLDSVLISLEKPYTASSEWGLSFAYTYSNGRENRGNAYDRDEHYLFDYPNLDGATFMPSLGLAKHRLVATGIIDGAADITFSGKLTLASPSPKEALNCHEINFSNCFFDPFTPRGEIGFKQLDLAAQKKWDLFGDTKLRFRVDVLNVFNWRNFTDFDTWRGGPSPDFNPNYGNRNGRGQTLPTRMLKLTAGFEW